MAATEPPPHLAPLLDLEELRRVGYLVLPEVVPPAQLDSLRANCEELYERHWDEDGTAGGSLSRAALGANSHQPRVRFERVISPECADVIDFVVGPSTQGVSHTLMAGGDENVQTLPVRVSQRHCAPPV